MNLDEVLGVPLGAYLDDDPKAVITACGVRTLGGVCGERLKRCPQPETEVGLYAECPKHGHVPIFPFLMA